LITGFTCGAFDVLHAGHLAMLKECKDNCDYLIVGLHSDPSIDRPTKNKPVQTILERYIQLSAISYVNKIIPYDTEEDLENLLGILPIQKRFIGADHIHEIPTGKQVCDNRNIEIIYNIRYHNWSSTNLRNRLK